MSKRTGTPKFPIDTVLGIIERLNNDVRPNAQCPSTYSSGCSTAFCTKRKGHDGDHRGYRAQWNAQGQKVKITEKQP